MKTLCLRGKDIVKRVRAILVANQHDPDKYLPHKSVESDEPYIAGLGALMHDTCNTASKAAKLIIEAKNAAGVAFYGEAGWAAMPLEDRETFDGLCFNHTRQLPVTAYDRLSAAELAKLLGPLAGELRAKMGPLARIVLDGLSFMRSLSKLLDPK